MPPTVPRAVPQCFRPSVVCTPSAAFHCMHTLLQLASSVCCSMPGRLPYIFGIAWLCAKPQLSALLCKDVALLQQSRIGRPATLQQLSRQSNGWCGHAGVAGREGGRAGRHCRYKGATVRDWEERNGVALLRHKRSVEMAAFLDGVGPGGCATTNTDQAASVLLFDGNEQ